jgi:hypothetical protein
MTMSLSKSCEDCDDCVEVRVVWSLCADAKHVCVQPLYIVLAIGTLFSYEAGVPDCQAVDN